MKNSQISVLLFISGLILAGQLALAVYAEQMQYHDLMMVIPYGTGISSYDVKAIRKVTGASLDVTYEAKKRALAEVVGAGSYPVTLIGTNSSYCGVMGVRISEGSFFMEEAVRAGSRYAVLNEKAAFELFGSRNIIGNTILLDGEIFVITGIVENEIKKEAAVYVPSTTITAPVPVLMVKTKAAPESVRSDLMPLGVYETNSRVVDIHAVARSFWQQLLVGIGLYCALFLMLLTYRRVHIIRGCCLELKRRLEVMYPGQLMAVSRKVLLMLAGHVLIVAAEVGTLLFLLRHLLKIVLGWKDILQQYRYLSDYFFQGKVQWLVRYFYCGTTLFLGVIGLLLVIAGIRLRRAVTHVSGAA